MLYVHGYIRIKLLLRVHMSLLRSAEPIVLTMDNFNALELVTAKNIFHQHYVRT